MPCKYMLCNKNVYAKGYCKKHYCIMKDKINKELREKYQNDKEYRDNLINRTKKYYVKNKFDRKEYGKVHYQNNKEKYQKYFKKHHKKVCDELSEISRKYYLNNKEKCKKKAVLYANKKYKTDENFRQSKILTNKIAYLMKKIKNNKKMQTEEIVGCSYDTFKKHIEKHFEQGMTWKNYGKNGWHIHFIRQRCSFDLTEIKNQKKCSFYKNIIPKSIKKSSNEKLYKIENDK